MEMEKIAVIVAVWWVVMTMGVVEGIDQGPKAVEEWFESLSHAKEKVSKLHFYFHDIVSGKHPTAYEVARANITAGSPTFFGLTRVVDNPLTVGPQLGSKQVGRVQGLYASAGLEEVGLLMVMNFVFTQGKYNGSTLSLLGRNPIFNTYREMPILGGTGVFRLARGIATAQTYTFNTANQNAVVEYNVMVIHY